MSSTTDKIKGVANEAAGKVKQDLGHATGNTHLEAEGVGQKVRGKAQKAVGDAKSAVNSAADKVKKATR